MTSWKKTFYSAYFAQIMAIMGFSLVMPFLPLYLKELNLTDETQVKIWAGIIVGAPALTLMLASPFWGILADKYGRKPMVLRAMFGGCGVLILMALARTHTQLFACRLLQGVLTGTVGASVALVASVAPSDRRGYTLGMMQSAVYTGFAIGPLMGGVISDFFGMRWACVSGAVILFFAALLIKFGTREEFDPSEVETAGHCSGFKVALMAPGFFLASMVLMSIRFSNSMATPAFPLIVEELWHDKDTVKSIVGFIVACGGAMAAVSAAITGRMSDRWGHKRILVIFTLATAATFFAHYFACDVRLHSVRYLFIVRSLFGLTVAGMIPPTNAIIRNVIHAKNVGKAFGLATSLGTFGWVVGPVISGFVMVPFGLRAPFILGGIFMLLVTVLILTCISSDHDQAKVENR